MSRKGGKSSGKIALKLAVTGGAVSLVGGLLVAIAVIANLSPAIAAADADAVKKGWLVGLLLAGVAGVLGAIAGWVLGGQLGTRLTDLGLAVSKLGRGGTEVKVRSTGNDEIGALGRGLQFLATDLAKVLGDQEKGGGGVLVSMDPAVKQLRDKVVPQQLPDVAGYEIDGSLAAGSRGGLDYFDLVRPEGDATTGTFYLVSGEGNGALTVVACRLARDELHRALTAGAAPRKALAHVNKVLKQALPPGCCARATLLQLGPDGAKLYQAGARTPLLICQRGEVLELAAEGIALGLDEGPVFDKALRPQDIAMSPGTRLVLCNDTALRTHGFLDLLRQNSPKHTAMFMNMVLGGLEQDAGSEGLREDIVLLTAKKAGQA